MSGDDWAGPWIADRLRKHTHVQTAEALSAHTIQVIRKKLSPVTLGAIARDRVTGDVVSTLFVDTPQIGFVVNAVKRAIIEGEAFAVAKTHNAGIGAYSDLLRALSMPDVSGYVNPKIQWIERGMQQHTRIKEFLRLDDSRYLITRRERAPVIVMFLEEYEISADAVRTAISRYGSFDAIVKTNPNGSITTQAYSAAQSAGRKILTWRDFLAELNHQWS